MKETEYTKTLFEAPDGTRMLAVWYHEDLELHIMKGLPVPGGDGVDWLIVDARGGVETEADCDWLIEAAKERFQDLASVERLIASIDA